MNRFSFDRPRSFRLAAATQFYEGFLPGSGMAAAATDRLTLAFRLDHTFEAVAVRLKENSERIDVEVVGTQHVERVQKQVARMLGLDCDAAAWEGLRDQDPVVGRLQDAFPGFFTAAKPSPYDAATWAIIVPRMNMKQAARIKIGMAERFGDRVEIGGRSHDVFPSPAVLAEIESFPGLSEEKTTRLRGIGDAALRGALDASHLRSLGDDRALSELQRLRGVGPWAASHIYYRGAAIADALPTAEPRVIHGLADAYEIDTPSTATFERIAESWRPFRMWVCVLLARHLARSDGWRDPRLPGERTAAGRALSARLRKTAPRSATA